MKNKNLIYFFIGTPSTNTNELKSSHETELSDEDKRKHEKTLEPLPPRDREDKHTDDEKKSE